MSHAYHSRENGFTLIEVTFALLLMALGMFAVFHLFPSGLRSSIDANAYTRQAEFAADVFEALRAEAAENWDGVAAGTASVTLGDGTPVDMDHEWENGAIEYPRWADQTQNEYVRYEITVAEGAVMGNTNRLVHVSLDTRFGRTGMAGEKFYTDLYRFGIE